MKKIYSHILCLICWLLAGGAPVFTKAAEGETGGEKETDKIVGAGKHEVLPDSVLTDDHVYEYTFSDFDKAVRIMEELRKRKTISQYRLDVTEGDLYFNTGRYRQALKFYKRVMESDSVRNSDKEYMEQAHRMISSYDCLHDEVRKAHYVRLLLQKAEECGNMEMKSIALFNMGKMLYYQEDKPRGYELIKEAIDLMKQTDYKYKYDNLRYDYNSLFIMQQRDKDYEDALATLEELEKVVTEATREEPVIEGLADKERKTLFAHRAVILSRLGRMEEAESAYHSWENTGKAYTKDDYLIVPYLLDRKKYDKVIEMYTPREAFLHDNKDTVNYHMMTVKRSLGKAYEGKGNYRLAAQYYEALAILTDSLKTREQHSSAMELATVYETQEKEAELQEQTERVKRHSVLLLSAGGILLALLILLLLNVRYTRTVRRKNKAMVSTIRDLLSYKDELEETRRKLREATENDGAAGLPDDALPAGKDAAADNDAMAADTEKGTGTEETASPEVKARTNEATDANKGNCADRIADADTEDADGRTDEPYAERCEEAVNDTEEEEKNRLLFEKLDDAVTRDKLYLNPDLSREDLVKLTGVNKTRVGRILQQNTGLGTTGYINKKRLEFAVRLLKSNPDFTIPTIAEKCGLPNVPTFNRLFRTKYGMTPSEYRKTT